MLNTKKEERKKDEHVFIKINVSTNIKLYISKIPSVTVHEQTQSLQTLSQLSYALGTKPWLANQRNIHKFRRPVNLNSKHVVTNNCNRKYDRISRNLAKKYSEYKVRTDMIKWK